MSVVIVDGVAYTVYTLRRIIREHHDLTVELALCRDTLRRRTEALNRLAEQRAALSER